MASDLPATEPLAVAFANSIAVVTAAFHVLLRMVAIISPAAFEILFNAQSLGARVGSLLPREPSWATSSARA